MGPDPLEGFLLIEAITFDLIVTTRRSLRNCWVLAYGAWTTYYRYGD
jgi:hypothetical protein